MTALQETPLFDSLMDFDPNSIDLPPELAAEVREYARKTHDQDTKRCYEISLRQWTTFCGGDVEAAFPAPPKLVPRYIVTLAKKGLSAWTIRNKLIPIATVHRARGWPSIYTYVVRTLLRAVFKELGERRNRKRPTSVEQLLLIKKVVDTEDNQTRAVRDWAILLFGFWGALRRSETADACLKLLEWTDNGVVYNLPTSKGDPYGEGQSVLIPAKANLDICPIAALQHWLRIAHITAGPIFREITAHGTVGTSALTPDAIGRIVKRYVECIGLDPDLYGGHSLRRGWATHANAHGESLTSIQRKLRHGSIKYTRGYVDRPSPADVNLTQRGGC